MTSSQSAALKGLMKSSLNGYSYEIDRRLESVLCIHSLVLCEDILFVRGVEMVKMVALYLDFGGRFPCASDLR